MRYNKWITYAAMAFIAYSILTSHYGEIKKTVQENVTAVKSIKPVTPPEKLEKGTATEKRVTNIMEAFVQTETGKKFMSDVIKKESSAPLDLQTYPVTIVDSLVGAGEPVICGQKVTVHYTATTEDGKAVDSTRISNHPLSFEPGKGSVIKGLELGVLGMRVGGTRKLTIPPALAYDNPAFATNAVPPLSTIRVDVELLQVAPALPENKIPLQISSQVEGSGKAASCGDTVLLQYTVSTADGNKLFSSKDTGKPFSFQLGDKAAAIGLTQSIESMKMGGSRSIVMPPALLNNLSGTPSTLLPKGIAVPVNELIKLDVELLTVF
jgi:FKBP-type peptidyl-prolyl cis-trans isomerase